MAVVIWHVYKIWHWFATKFTSGGLHEKHVVATWNVGNHLSIRLKTDTGKPSKTCVEVAGRRTFRVLTFSQQSDIMKLIMSGDEYKSSSSSLCSFLFSPVMFCLLGPNSTLSTEFSETLQQNFKINDTKSHFYPRTSISPTAWWYNNRYYNQRKLKHIIGRDKRNVHKILVWYTMTECLG